MAVLGNGIKGGASGSQGDMPGTAATAVAFSEPDEARAAFQQLIAPVSFQVPRETPLVWQVTSGELGPLTFVMDVVPGGFQLATADAEDRYVLVFQLAGTMSVDHGGTRGATQPGRTSAIFSLMRPGTCNVAPGSSQRAVIIERKTLDDHLRKLTRAQPRHPVLFDPLINLESAAGARLEQLVTFAAMETQRPEGVDASPLFARGLSETLLSTLLELVPHNHTSLLSRAAPRVAPACVRLAEACIGAHAAEPITVVDVADAVGVSVRALQASFRRFRDRSPLDHLKTRRLEQARARLLDPTPGLTVGQVAHAAGYGHVGYFIREYERQFGERPGVTLARRR